MSVFRQLSRPALENLAAALEAGRLAAPFSAIDLTAYIPPEISSDVAVELENLHAAGMAERHVALTLRLLSEERGASQGVGDRVGLVWTGREIPGTESRDTAVVVRELFQSARHSVLIVSYAVDRGRKARRLFAPLADRMDADPDLRVRMFLNVRRPHGNWTSDGDLLRAFGRDFRRDTWPGKRLPEVFYDPRSLSRKPGPKACLHAKCVVADEDRLLITSANFTEAAHERNIEAGVLLDDPAAAGAMRRQFERLVQNGTFQKIPGC